MEILTNEKDILQMARDERCSSYTAELLVKDLNELTTLREAGEKMAERLRALRAFEDEWNMRDTPRNFFTDDDAAALTEWEAANK